MDEKICDFLGSSFLEGFSKEPEPNLENRKKGKHNVLSFHLCCVFSSLFDRIYSTNDICLGFSFSLFFLFFSMGKQGK